MKTILVATDFSVRSDRALLRAKLIARRTNASLVIAYVVDEDQQDRLIASSESSALAVLSELTQTLTEQDGICAQSHVIVADIPTGILSAAKKTAADLIIVGSHRSRALDVFTGTTVERVVRRTDIPLLIAVDVPSTDYRRTLLAMNFDKPSKAAACTALELGLFDHTQVTVMHAFDTPGESMMRRALVESTMVDAHRADRGQAASQHLHDLLGELQLPRSTTHVVAIKGTPARTILESAKADGADLIMLGASQRKGFERLLVGSVTSDIIRDSHRDVLIVPVP